MTRNEQVVAQLEKYTLAPDPKLAEEMREIIHQEIGNEDRDDNGILKLSCSQLFSIGQVEDSLLIWKAKRSDFDAACYLDIRLLCGASLGETKEFLSN